MKSLQVFNLVLVAAGAAMGLVMGVVCVLYAANLDLEPSLRRELPLLLELTAWFMALSAAAALAWLAQRSGGLRWPTQALPLIPVMGLVLFARNLVS